MSRPAGARGDDRPPRSALRPGAVAGRDANTAIGTRLSRSRSNPITTPRRWPCSNRPLMSWTSSGFGRQGRDSGDAAGRTDERRELLSETRASGRIARCREGIGGTSSGNWRSGKCKHPRSFPGSTPRRRGCRRRFRRHRQMQRTGGHPNHGARRRESGKSPPCGKTGRRASVLSPEKAGVMFAGP
jgi:hypothetical protein